MKAFCEKDFLFRGKKRQANGQDENFFPHFFLKINNGEDKLTELTRFLFDGKAHLSSVKQALV